MVSIEGLAQIYRDTKWYIKGMNYLRPYASGNECLATRDPVGYGWEESVVTSNYYYDYYTVFGPLLVLDLFDCFIPNCRQPAGGMRWRDFCLPLPSFAA